MPSIDQRMKRADHRQLEFAKARLVEQKNHASSMLPFAECTQIGQVELRSPASYNRIKIGIAQAPIRFQAAQVHAARAVLFAELELIGDAMPC